MKQRHDTGHKAQNKGEVVGGGHLGRSVVDLGVLELRQPVDELGAGVEAWIWLAVARLDAFELNVVVACAGVEEVPAWIGCGRGLPKDSELAGVDVLEVCRCGVVDAVGRACRQDFARLACLFLTDCLV